MPRTLIQSDDFNRAALGTNWGQLNTGNGGNVQIDSSIRISGQYTLQPVDQSCAARWVGAGTFTDDQYSSVKLSIPSLNNPVCTAGVIARAGSGVNNLRSYYEFYVELNNVSFSLTTRLTRWLDGTRKVLATSNVTWASGDTIDIEVVGTTIRGCKNGVALGAPFTVTDATITTGLPGATVAGGAAMFADDWAAGNYTAPTGLAFSGPIPAQTATVGTAQADLPLAGYWTGGNTPISYAVSAGALPNAWVLNSSTGVLTRGASIAGSYAFTVTATDATPTSVASNSVGVTISEPAATAITMSGPAGGLVSTASTNFTVGANGAISGSHIVTPSSGGGGGTFTPSTVTLTSASPAGTFTYTPASSGSKTISATDAGGYAAPASLTYASAASAGRLVFATAATDKFRTFGGVLLASQSATFWVSDPTTGALVAKITQSTDAAGLVGTLTHSAIALNTLYRVNYEFPGGEYCVTKRTSEAT